MKNELINDAKKLLKKVKKSTEELKAKKEEIKGIINDIDREIAALREQIEPHESEWKELNNLIFINFRTEKYLNEFINKKIE